MQSRIQCLCLALKDSDKEPEAKILAHHDIAQRLRKGMEGAIRGWTIVSEQTMDSEGLLGLPQPEDQMG